MRDSVRLYFLYMGVSLRAQMQYRASFIMFAFGQFLTFALEYSGVVAMFDRFGTLRGWKLPEVALLYGIVQAAFAIAEILGRGFDMFGNVIKAGDFDRLLLRPRGTLLQVAASDFPFMRVGRLLMGLLVLFWAVANLAVHWTLAKVLLLLAAIASGSCVFYGLFVLQATVCFWTIESLEVFNIVTYGGTETASYPLTVYRPWFRLFFTFVVPLACMNYIPASAILERGAELGVSPVLQWTAPFIGLVFLLLTFQVWKLGVRRYASTGS
jgi:ABC-2 type transport system permease protein